MRVVPILGKQLIKLLLLVIPQVVSLIHRDLDTLLFAFGPFSSFFLFLFCNFFQFFLKRSGNAPLLRNWPKAMNRKNWRFPQIATHQFIDNNALAKGPFALFAVFAFLITFIHPPMASNVSDVSIKKMKLAIRNHVKMTDDKLVNPSHTLQAQQSNFLSFIQPFVGAAVGGGRGQFPSSLPFLQQPPAPSPSGVAPQQSPAVVAQQSPQQAATANGGSTNSFGGIGQFVEVFQNIRQPNPSAGSDRVQQVASMAQVRERGPGN